MLLLLMMLAVMGLLAGQLVPSREGITQRKNEGQLRATLAEIRQAFDLKELSDSSFNPDLSSPLKISQTLGTLETGNFLRCASIADPLFYYGQWNTGTYTYWLGSTNISFNTSFESTTPPDLALSEAVASWNMGSLDTLATVDIKFFPSQYSGDFDDYQGQNKLGKKLQVTGQSLKIGN